MIYTTTVTANDNVFYNEAGVYDYGWQVISTPVMKKRPKPKFFCEGHLVRVTNSKYKHLIGRIGKIKFVRGRGDYTIRFLDGTEWTFYSSYDPPFEHVKYAWRKL